MLKKECIAMLLAGGQGSRLGILTKKLAKPAVPFGGKYRIIDFTLSNCSNSNIDTVGVLTQYQPLILNSYIGNGSHWDLDRKDGGITVLPPYVKDDGGEWYKGTANAIYQNVEFIDQYSPQYVLVVSGDHIYSMDYSAMLDYHKEKKADVTIAVIEVPWEEASRFGIMNTGAEDRIVEFDEKPSNPKNNLASMGVYLFNWEKLRKHLIEDEQNPHSSHDFGKNVIPKMLGEGELMYAYPFKGYWKDVGTLQSLWEANMDLLSENPALDLYNHRWRIYSVNPTQPPQYIAAQATIKNALINEGCQVFGELRNTILFPGVYVGEGSVIEDSVIMPNAYIGKNVYIKKTIMGEETIVEDHCQVSDASATDLTVIGEKIRITEGTIIKSGTVVAPDYHNVGENK